VLSKLIRFVWVYLASMAISFVWSYVKVLNSNYFYFCFIASSIMKNELPAHEKLRGVDENSNFTMWANSNFTLYVTQYWETVPNCTSGKIKLTPPAYSLTTVLLVSYLKFGLLTILEADCSRGEFMVIWKARMAASGTGKCLGWLYPVLLLDLVAQMSIV